MESFIAELEAERVAELSPSFKIRGGGKYIFPPPFYFASP